VPVGRRRALPDDLDGVTVPAVLAVPADRQACEGNRDAAVPAVPAAGADCGPVPSTDGLALNSGPGEPDSLSALLTPAVLVVFPPQPASSKNDKPISKHKRIRSTISRPLSPLGIWSAVHQFGG
jgi:hypothetical protein